MPNLNFFADHDDFIEIFDHLFAQTDVQVFETYSEFDQELRRFRSTAAMLSPRPGGMDKYGNGFGIVQLALWSPSVLPEPEIERIDLVPSTGHTFRYCVQNNENLMSLHLGQCFGNSLTKSIFSYDTEEGARWNRGASPDWPANRKLVNKIIYLIGRKLRVARVPGASVLRSALEKKAQGCQFTWGSQVYEIVR